MSRPRSMLDALGGRAREALRAPRGRVIAAAAAAAILVLVLVLSLSGGGGDGGESEGTSAGGGGATGQEAPASAKQEPLSPAERILEEMTVERRVAQLMLVGFEGSDTGDSVFDELEERDYGGLVIQARNYRSPEQVSELADEASTIAEDADHAAPWVMAPQEGGDFRAFADLPPEEAPAEIDSPEEAAALATETAEALLDIGVNGLLAPVLDVGPVGGGAIGARAYSDIEDQVTGYAIATLNAFEEADIFVAPKHFPGLGAASQPTEAGPASVGLSLEQLQQRDLVPFRAAIELGVPGIVVGPGLYAIDDFVTPASTSATVVTDLLRDQLGFEGLAIADDVTSPAITSTLAAPDAAVDAVRAGIDLVQVGGGESEREAVHQALLGAVRSGAISRERLDEAVLRNLEAKDAAGVLPDAGAEAGGGDAGNGGSSGDG